MTKLFDTPFKVPKCLGEHGNTAHHCSGCELKDACKETTEQVDRLFRYVTKGKDEDNK